MQIPLICNQKSTDCKLETEKKMKMYKTDMENMAWERKFGLSGLLGGRVCYSDS